MPEPPGSRDTVLSGRYGDPRHRRRRRRYQRIGTAAAQGQTVLAPKVAARLLGQLRTPATEKPTDRELEVLALVARGLTNRAIAARLHISEATVKTHLVHVFSKLGVDDRTAAVTVALERGMLFKPGLGK